MNDTPWLDEREQRVWRAFLYMQGELMRRSHRQLQRESGLSGADYAVLVNLSEAPEGRLRVFQLRGLAEWEKTRLTHQVTRMVQRGLVKREPCPDDPRGAFVVLTDAGREAITEAAPRHVAFVRRMFIDVLTPGELDTLGELSARVVARLTEDDDDSPCEVC